MAFMVVGVLKIFRGPRAVPESIWLTVKKVQHINKWKPLIFGTLKVFSNVRSYGEKYAVNVKVSSTNLSCLMIDSK